MNSPAPEQIKSERKLLGITQTEAAAIVHSVLGTWAQWESGKRAMHPAFWELFLIKVEKLKRSRRAAKANELAAEACDPWVAGRMLSKFGFYQHWPSESECEEWIDGFIMGCAESGKYPAWREELNKYTEESSAPVYIEKYAKQSVNPN